MSATRASETQAVLVTGASGFIGGHVVQSLHSAGYQVVAHHFKNPLKPEISALCKEIVTGDLCDQNIQRQALNNIQAVCHTAAYIPADYHDPGEAAHCYQVNALATLELATLAVECKIQRFVHFSTANMYSKTDHPSEETDRIFPTGPAAYYFASKLAAELYLATLSEISPLDAIILRAGAPYGPGEPKNKVIPTFLSLAKQEKPLHLHNGGLAKANFIYVKDLADLAATAIAEGQPGIYNAASGENTSMLDLAQIIKELFPEKSVELIIESAAQGDIQGFPPLSIEKTRKAFGFQPRSLIDGLLAYRSAD